MAALTLSRESYHRALAWVLITFVVLGVIQNALSVPTMGAQGIVSDFDAFYLTGQLVLEGRAAEAHDVERVAAVQRALTGQQNFMPWTYPPHFDLMTAALPLLPRGLSYAVFTLSSLALFLLLIARLAGPAFLPILLCGALPIYVTASVGQNAFLTGALMAGFVRLSLRNSALAGLPLGLMAIKPHLAIGLGVQALAGARWQVLALAIAVALAFGALATLVLGGGIWPAFRQGLATATQAMGADFYPFVRMTSLYALLHSLGVAPGLALAGQICLAVAACGAVVWCVRARLPLRWSLAAGCFASTLISPYVYDYDMVLALVGAALIGPDVLRRTLWTERLLLLLSSWVAGGWGLIHALGTLGMGLDARAERLREAVSLGAVAYLGLLVFLVAVLRRETLR